VKLVIFMGAGGKRNILGSINILAKNVLYLNRIILKVFFLLSSRFYL